MGAAPDFSSETLVPRTVRTGSHVFVLQVVLIAAQLVTSIIVVRKLGSTAYGEFAIAGMISMLLGFIVTGGLENAMPRFVPELMTQRHTAAVHRLVLCAILGVAILWSLLMVVYLLGLNSLVEHFYGGSVSHLVLLSLILAPLGALQGILSQTLMGFFLARTQIIASVVSSIITVTLVAVFAHTAGQVIVIAAAGALSADLILAARYLRLLGSLPVGGGVAPLARAIRYSLSFVAGNLLNAIVYRQSETLVLGAFVSATVVATYNVAYALPLRILEFLPLVLLSVGSISVAEAFSRDRTSLPRAVDAYYRILFLFVAPVSVGGFVLGGTATKLLFGPGYSQAAYVSQYFFALFALVFLTTPYSLVIRAWERVWTGVGLKAMQSVVNIAFDIVLIARYGLHGAVAAVTITVVFSTVTNLVVLGRVDRTVRVPWAHIGRCFLAALPMLLLLPLARFATRPLTWLLLAAASLVIWLVTVRLFRLLGSTEQRFLAELPLPPNVRRRLVALLAAPSPRR